MAKKRKTSRGKRRGEPLTFPTFRGGVPGWERFQPPHGHARQLELFGTPHDDEKIPPPGDPAWDEVPICEGDDWCNNCGAPAPACQCLAECPGCGNLPGYCECVEPRRNSLGHGRRTEIIGVHVPKAKFSATMAQRWAREHGFRVDKSDTTTNWYRFRQLDSVGFGRVFTKTLPNGVQLIIGVY